MPQGDSSLGLCPDLEFWGKCSRGRGLGGKDQREEGLLGWQCQQFQGHRGSPHALPAALRSARREVGQTPGSMESQMKHQI